MNRSNAHLYLPLVQALAAGRLIQANRKGDSSDDNWVTLAADDGEVKFTCAPELYRTQPRASADSYSSHIRMAKATDADVDAAISVACAIEGLHKGYYPAAERDEQAPTFFDEDNPEHLRAFYERMLELTKHVGGGLSRVAGGMHCILHNSILDPDDDCLALHPRLCPAATLPAAAASKTDGHG